MTDQTSLKLTDERKLLFDRASQNVASDPSDDPPRSDVIDAALTHLFESHENIENVRDRYPAQIRRWMRNRHIPDGEPGVVGQRECHFWNFQGVILIKRRRKNIKPLSSVCCLPNLAAPW